MEKGFVYSYVDDEVTVVPSPEIARLVIQMIDDFELATVPEKEDMENSNHDTAIANFPKEVSKTSFRKAKAPCLFSVTCGRRIQTCMITDKNTVEWFQAYFFRLVTGFNYKLSFINLENESLCPNEVVSTVWE